jgi:apolipoprotein N-acyltransferase
VPDNTSTLPLCKPGLVGDLCATGCGALVTASLAPFSLWPLALASLLALIFLLESLNPAQAARRGWFYGLGLFGTGTSWVYVSIHVYGNASVSLALFLVTLFSAGLALFTLIIFWCYARFLQHRPYGKLLGFPGIWVLGEWFRSWFLTGFPWLLTGYSHTDGPLSGWAPIIGVYGIGLLLALTASSLYWLFRCRGKFRWLPIGLCLLTWISSPALKQIEWVQPVGRPINVSLVQANIPQELKWKADQLDRILATYQALTEKLWGTDLVVWPEAAIPQLYDRAGDLVERLEKRATETNSSLVTGIPTRESHNNGFKFHNSIIALGNGQGRYNKQRLVPFGEYVPLDFWLRGLIDFFDLPMSNFSAGKTNQVPLRANGLTLGASICYEVVYPNLVSRSAKQADILITLSNDTWFGSSLGPLQHLQMARFRALENGRYMLRGTNNGISAIIDHNGKIRVRGKQFTREIINGQAQAMTGLTPLTRFGYFPALAISAMLVLIPYFLRKPPKSLQISGAF